MTEEPVEVRLGELLRSRGLKLATAKSCTGGLIGHKITSVPGSSEYFLGGVISYAYEAKVELLGVRWKTLEAHGAVSRETVLEMANGARERLERGLWAGGQRDRRSRRRDAEQARRADVDRVEYGRRRAGLDVRVSWRPRAG